MSRDRLIEELLDVLEEEAGSQLTATAPIESNAVSLYMMGDRQNARTIGEMREILRTTADLLEMEAAHLRQELDRLEHHTEPSVYH